MNVFVLFFACLLHFHLIFFSFKKYIYLFGWVGSQLCQGGSALKPRDSIVAAPCSKACEILIP